VIAKLAHEQIYLTPRIRRMRISSHVYNDEPDVDRFVTTVTRTTA
jgi:selenocysteine lyase/cysteine desulfurase